jgi:hypothetical protein
VANLRQVRNNATALEDSAYAGIAECGKQARVPLNDRLPHRVGLNDRPTRIKDTPMKTAKGRRKRM